MTEVPPGSSQLLSQLLWLMTLALPVATVAWTVTHEEVSFDALGGADVHGGTSGVAHFVHDSEPECLQALRELVGFLPLNNLDDPPERPTDDPADRRDESLLDLVPDSATTLPSPPGP